MGMRELFKNKGVAETKPFSASLKIDTIQKIDEMSKKLNVKKSEIINSAITDAYNLFKKNFQTE